MRIVLSCPSHPREAHEELADDVLLRQLGAQGRQAILARHTCAHRAEELVSILDALAAGRLRRHSLHAEGSRA